MKIWLIQSVIAPYRIELFKTISSHKSVDFSLVLLSTKFKTRPQWEMDFSALPFKVDPVWGLSIKSSPEHQYCINPFLIIKLLIGKPDVVICGGYSIATFMVFLWARLTGRKYVIWTEATMLTDGGIRGIQLFFRKTIARHASAFVDAGNVYTDSFNAGDLRMSTGISAIWISPIGPLSFSLAKPFRDQEEDQTQVFQFSIGTGI